MTDCQHLRIAFAGTPEFAVPPLQALAQSGHEVIAVYTQPDRRAGRGRKLAQSAVKQSAIELGIPCLQPESLRDPDSIQQLASLAPDIMVVVAYGQILPEAVLSIPALGCLNIHGSLLPRWRGAAPIHRAILAGDSTSGVCIMKMAAGLDTGPVILSRSAAIGQTTTTGQLHDTLSELGASCLLDTLQGWCAGELDAVAQNESLTTYAHKIDKAEAVIDWQQTALQIHRQIRAFNPWPVAETSLQGKKLRIWQAELRESGQQAVPGTVLRCDQTALEVAAADGSLLITELQLPGKKPVNFKDFVNGNAIAGVVLGDA